MKYLLIFLFTVSNAVYCNIPSGVHPHEMILISPMPEPYTQLETKIIIDPETHDIEEFIVKLDNEIIEFPDNIISQLKNIVLSTLITNYEMYNELNKDKTKMIHKGIFLSFEMQYGDGKVAQDQGLRLYGRDEIKVKIDLDKNFTVKTRNIRESIANSQKGMW
jgi:hypothetical protein